MIPVYNRSGGMLEKAIQSVLGQSYRDFRLVVVDDGSSDDLSAEKESVEEAGHRWICSRKNRGVAAARNLGAGAANSDWISFLDSDDIWRPEKLERQVEWHRRHPDVRISQVKEKWVRNGSEVRRPKHWLQREGDLFFNSILRCSIGPSCVMMRRDLWTETKGFDETFRVCEDYELWLRICRVEQVGLVPGKALTMKTAGHGDQLSVTVPALDRYRVFALLKMMRDNGLSAVHKEWVAEGIQRKSAVLTKGARKRGSLADAQWFSEMTREIHGSTDEKRDEWSRVLWGILGENHGKRSPDGSE